MGIERYGHKNGREKEHSFFGFGHFHFLKVQKASPTGIGWPGKPGVNDREKVSLRLFLLSVGLFQHGTVLFLEFLERFEFTFAEQLLHFRILVGLQGFELFKF